MKKSIRRIFSSKLAWSCCIFLMTVFLFYFGLYFTRQKTDAERLRVTKAAIVRAAVSCYALEGMYPPDLSYLEEKYGLTIDHKRFFVAYQLSGSNIMPDIDVLFANGVNT